MHSTPNALSCAASVRVNLPPRRACASSIVSIRPCISTRVVPALGSQPTTITRFPAFAAAAAALATTVDLPMPPFP